MGEASHPGPHSDIPDDILHDLEFRLGRMDSDSDDELLLRPVNGRNVVRRRAIEDVASNVPVTVDTVPADVANLHSSRIQWQRCVACASLRRPRRVAPHDESQARGRFAADTTFDPDHFWPAHPLTIHCQDDIWEKSKSPKPEQYSPCSCEGVAGRRPATPSHEHGLCPPLGSQQKGRLRVQKWGFRV